MGRASTRKLCEQRCRPPPGPGVPGLVANPVLPSQGQIALHSRWQAGVCGQHAALGIVSRTPIFFQQTLKSGAKMTNRELSWKVASRFRSVAPEAEASSEFFLAFLRQLHTSTPSVHAECLQMSKEIQPKITASHAQERLFSIESKHLYIYIYMYNIEFRAPHPHRFLQIPEHPPPPPKTPPIHSKPCRTILQGGPGTSRAAGGFHFYI